MTNVQVTLCGLAWIIGTAGIGLGATPQDIQLADHVQQRLRSDSQLKSDRILVQADDGHVVLSGTVDTAYMKQAATGAAMSVAGVRSIDNHLAVAGEAPSDVQLEASVMDVMNRSALTAGSTIVVHAAKGEVRLEGVVPSESARREATRLAQTVLGVHGIRNRLSVTNAQTAGASSGY